MWKPQVGLSYNISSVSAAARNHPNPIFRGIIREIYGEKCSIEVTEYNITHLYNKGQRVPDIHLDRLTPIHVQSNQDALVFLNKEE